MPLIEVDLERSLFEEKHTEISRAIHDAQIMALKIPADDLFQVFRPHDSHELKFDPTYNGVDRRSLLLIRITMVHIHSVETKRALYEAVVGRLADLGVRPEDLLISVVENGFEDWYAGKV